MFPVLIPRPFTPAALCFRTVYRDDDDDDDDGVDVKTRASS